MAQAIGHLRSLGHARIGLLLGPSDHVPSNRKLAAARRIARRGWPRAAGGARRALASTRSRRPRRPLGGCSPEVSRAIVCASDLMALGAIRAARRQGLDVPRDVSVVGYDDRALMNFTDPPLTTVRQPIEAMGRMVIELLLAPDGRPHRAIWVRSASSRSSSSEARPLRRALARCCTKSVDFLHSSVGSDTLPGSRRAAHPSPSRRR